MSREPAGDGMTTPTPAEHIDMADVLLARGDYVAASAHSVQALAKLAQMADADRAIAATGKPS